MSIRACIKYRVSADIGGTFTDIVVEPSDGPGFRRQGGHHAGKSGPRASSTAFSELVPDLADVEFFVHGTTVGLNAFLERKANGCC